MSAERVYPRAVRAGVTAVVVAIAVIAGGAARGDRGPAGAAKPEKAAKPTPAAKEAADKVDTVALLPLATGKGFELYGHPVASEVARALRAGGLEVVVVGAGASVPDRARLVIDGTIAAAPKHGVALQVRVRDPQKGVAIATLEASAPELTALDRAAADLAARLLPAVKAQLAAMSAPADEPAGKTPAPIAPAVAPSVALDQPIAITFGTSVDPDFPDVAAAELAHRLVARTGRVARDGVPLTGQPLDGDYGLAVEVRDFAIELDGVYTARATARVRWIDRGGHVIVDRVVHTDTLVGSRRDDATGMVRHAAAQLADILAPHVIAWAKGAR